MDKLFRRVPFWIWLVLAAIFILSQVVPCLAFDRSENFWAKQPCGFKEVEFDRGDVPKEVWSKATLLMSKNRRCVGTEQVNGRIYSICIKSDLLAVNYQVRSIKIHRGGEVIYSRGEKICR